MKTRKRRVETLSFYDHTGIENHLTEMARKGWMIERISNFYWTYRKIEPQELHFTVSYFSKASDFAPGPSEAQQTLMDFCAASGWELACTWFQMQIFYNAAEDPTPIHTDPVLEVEALHKACKANYLIGCKIIFVLSLILTGFFVSGLISDLLHILASPSAFLLGMCGLILFLQSTVDLVTYYSWHKKAKKSAEQEIFLGTPSTSRFQKILLFLLLASIVCWAVNLLSAKNHLLALNAVFMFLCIAITTALTNLIKSLLKKKKVSAGVNRLITGIASFGIAFVLIIAIIPIEVHIFSAIPSEDQSLHIDSPLQISDLLDTSYDNYLNTKHSDETLLLSELEIDQSLGFGDEASTEIPEMHYRLLTVKVPMLYHFCENQLKRHIIISAYWDGELVEQDPAAWGADRAYRLIPEGDSEETVYMLCYGNKLVEITFNWEPTPEQMAIAGEKLN